MITIVDYGIGNIRAFLNVYKRLNIAASPGSTVLDIERAELLILPGVGAFDWAMGRLNQSGLREVLDEVVLVRKIPVLGVCVGMQMMGRFSDEGELAGLGWIGGNVRKIDFAHDDSSVSLPHMGWNDVQSRGSHPLFGAMPEWPRFYFLHSYYFVADDPGHVIAECDYFGRFASAIAFANIAGVQFHPEKSHRFGIQLLKNFAGT